MKNSVLITVKDLVKTFPMGKSEFTALKDVNLTFAAGEFAGIVGPSGSGKTTLLNIIGSLDVATKGQVVVMGKAVNELSQRQAADLRNRYLGFIFQTYNLLPVYTVYENVELPLLLLKMSAIERKKAVLGAIEWVGLLDKIKSRPAQLSGGECQRVSIARAMVKEPKIVLADEPTANLDAKNSHNILQTMEKLNSELSTTFIFATHDEKVIQYLHRKISLEDGRVVADELIENNR
ncbi:MAG: ABC transporter ATP-binding protein [Candidatus Marinimicrobia bacterium]|nr:ABC transporter ATP-binding protein [Candidatus Neomarinimicrobiota bacterium]